MAYSFKVSQVFNRMSAGLLMAALIMSSLPFAAMTAEALVSGASVDFISTQKASYSQNEELVLAATRGAILPQTGGISVSLTSSNGGQFSGGNLNGSCSGQFSSSGEANISGNNSQKAFCYRNANSGNDTITATFTQGTSTEVVTLRVLIDEAAQQEVNPQITLCHATQADKNPYNLVTTDAKSIVNLPNGHDDHVDGGLDDVGDIIPPFTYNFDGSGTVNYLGLNWTRVFSSGLTGEEIHNGGLCNGRPANKSADLEIVKTVSTTSPAVGSTIVYTLTVTNLGPNDATGVIVTDPLASGLSYVSSTIVPNSTNPLTWQVGGLVNGGTWTTNVTATVGSTVGVVSISNTATVIGSITDPFLTNNSDTETVRTIVPPNVIPGCTDVNATNHNPAATQDNGSCTYELTVTKVVAGTTTADFTAFSFSVDGGTALPFEVDGTNVVIVSSSTHNVVETTAAGYTTTYTNCSPVVFTTGKATCTITNTPVNVTKYGALVVEKKVEGVTTPNFTAFSFILDGGATTTFEVDGVNEFSLPVGTHTVLETPASGYTTTYNNCRDVAISEGATTTCTITNTLIVNETKYGTLRVEKKVEGVTTPDYTNFSFILDGGATTTFNASGTNDMLLPVGAHTVVETEAVGFSTSYSNCNNALVAEGTTTVCTITNTKDSGPAPTCTVEVVSNTSDFVVEKGAFAQVLSFVHPAWTAVISGATWIWGDNPVINPVVDETQTFRKQFGFTGTVTDAKLYVASDNSHSVVFNASSTAGDAAENNFQLATQDVYDVTTLVAQGNNELKIAVTNKAVANSNPASNPAGLLYKLVISGRPTVDADCSVPYVPPTPEVDTYRVEGYVWHDDNKNTEWDGLNSEEQNELLEDSLAGWTVNITNGTSSFSTTTDETGFYYFDVPAGTWTITEVVQNGWERTTQESHVVTVPIAPVVTLLDSVRNFFIPTAHAALLATYGDYNFGNDTTDTVITTTPNRSGGGGRGTVRRPNPTVAGDMDDALPTPLVLGEQVSIVPVGAPSTGAGGTSPQWPTFTLGQLMMGATRRSK